MPQFSYKARKRSGELVEGVLEVPDRSAAQQQIQRSGLFPIAITDVNAGATPSAKGKGKNVNLIGLLPASMQASLQQKRKPKLQELATFTTQLANLLNSGMPLTVALNSMTHLQTKGIPAEVSKELKQEVTEGRSLSDAMTRQPVIFSDLYVNMVRAGETSGSLVPVLRRMATHFQQFADVQAKFKSAMIYPVMVIGVGILLVTFFMTVMMPKFIEIFQGFNIPLPLPTLFLIGVSRMFTHYWWALAGVIILLIALFKRFSSSAAGGRKMDGWRMKAPIFGPVVRVNLFGQFARTLGTLLQNGVPVLTALKITEQVMSNVHIKEAIAKTREAVTDGKTLAQPLAQSRLFPQLMVDLVRIGEETGDVPGSLNNLADTYEGELQIALRVMSDLIGPVLIIVMAIVVGFLLLSIFLPLFKLISSIR
ncbi:MAG TPA: type II secretion system F family protein [Candidatus Acidoferrales bacterium]|jgi:type IV pilus assembly protein PilC|nr:type II secretion system F family protein [Candidatus Acidoferrales bacterium]